MNRASVVWDRCFYMNWHKAALWIGKKTVTATIATSALMLLSLAAPAAAGETLHISSIDAGINVTAFEISTPWGDYAAIDEGGGAIWVGTLDDYEHARVSGVMKDAGFRISSVRFPGSTLTFVDSKSLHATIGQSHIDPIWPMVDFKSDTGSKTTKWVDVAWVSDGNVACDFYDPNTKTAYYPRLLDTSQPPFRTLSFVLPVRELTRSIDLIFLARGQRPAVLHLTSVAAQDLAQTTSRTAAAYGGQTPQRVTLLRSLMAANRRRNSSTKVLTAGPVEAGKPVNDTGLIQNTGAEQPGTVPSSPPSAFPSEVTIAKPAAPQSSAPELQVHVASATEIGPSRLNWSTTMAFATVVIHPVEDATFDASSFELLFPDGHAIAGTGFPTMILRNGQRRAMMVEFVKDDPAENFALAKLKWAYSTSPP